MGFFREVFDKSKAADFAIESFDQGSDVVPGAGTIGGDLIAGVAKGVKRGVWDSALILGEAVTGDRPFFQGVYDAAVNVPIGAAEGVVDAIPLIEHGKTAKQVMSLSSGEGVNGVMAQTSLSHDTGNFLRGIVGASTDEDLKRKEKEKKLEASVLPDENEVATSISSNSSTVSVDGQSTTYNYDAGGKQPEAKKQASTTENTDRGEASLFQKAAMVPIVGGVIMGGKRLIDGADQSFNRLAEGDIGGAINTQMGVIPAVAVDVLDPGIDGLMTVHEASQKGWDFDAVADRKSLGTKLEESITGEETALNDGRAKHAAESKPAPVKQVTQPVKAEPKVIGQHTSRVVAEGKGRTQSGSFAQNIEQQRTKPKTRRPDSSVMTREELLEAIKNVKPEDITLARQSNKDWTGTERNNRDQKAAAKADGVEVGRAN